MTGIRYLAFVLATASALHAQQAERAVPTIEPRYTRIFSSDTMGLWGPDISPDGRWVVASGPGDGDNTANLWIAPAAGGTAERCA